MPFSRFLENDTLNSFFAHFSSSWQKLFADTIQSLNFSESTPF